MSKRFKITNNTDGNEGKGKQKFIGMSFDTEEEAMEFVKSSAYADNYGVMGQAGSGLNVFDTKHNKSIVEVEWSKEYE